MLCFTLYIRTVSKYKPPPPGGAEGGRECAYIWRGDLTEGLLCYEFGGGGGGPFNRNITVFGLQQTPRQNEKKKYFICRLIINKPQSNLLSGDTSVQGTLSLAPRVSLE